MSLLAVILVASVAARDLPVPADKGWQHARTGLILPARLDGLARTRLSDNTQGEYDVLAEFADPDRSVIATLYVYQPAIDDVAMWFERSRAQIQQRDVYGGVEATTAEPVAFAPPGASGAPSALRQTFRAERAYKSTALAMMPLGRWLIAVRLSATKLDTGALDERLTRLIAAIRWPSPLPDAPVLHPIPACPAALAFDHAKVVKTQGADVLMTLLGASIASDPKVHHEEKPVAWCLDPATTRTAGIYRSIDGAKGYVIALQDAGRTVSVWPSLGAQIGTKGAAAYSVSLHDVDGRTDALPSFDRLPAPDQVMKLLGGGTLGSTTAGAPGKPTISINAKAL
jgi:hypothetical protein